MNLATAISMMVFLQAPADVPRDHWAFPAVDALFKEGLLKGYPPQRRQSLRLTKGLKRDDAQLKSWIKEWGLNGWVIGTSALHRQESVYQWAVDVHAMCSNMTWDFEKNVKRHRLDSEFVKALPNVVAAISMLEPELSKLGADADQMMTRLNEVYESHLRQFQRQKK